LHKEGEEVGDPDPDFDVPDDITEDLAFKHASREEMIVQLCAQFWDKFPNGTFDHEGEQCKMLRMEDLADINLHEHSKRGAHIKKNYSDLWTFVHVDAKYMNFLELTDKYNEITELDSFRLNDKHL